MLLRISILLLCISGLAHAQNLQKRPPVKNRSGIEIEYQQRLWNKDSKSIDTGYVVIQDSESNKTVVVQLQEREPDSSIFSGTYNIELGRGDNYVPSIYIPKSEQITNNQEKSKFLQSIKDGKEGRKPFILKKENQLQILEAFDNKKQAKAALLKYRRTKAMAKSERVLTDNELTEVEQLEKAKNLALTKQLTELEKQAALRRTDRQAQLKIEKEKLEGVTKRYNSLSATEKSSATLKASTDMQTAFTLFTSGDFKAADAFFWTALENNPSDNKALYSYAVNLFRQENYNKALNYFEIVSDVGIDKTEKLYYIASSHYKLIELEFAEDLFNKVKNSANKNLSGSAAFYLGLIQYQRENYLPAKAEFEFVLDNSIDPELDNQADAYIARIQQDLQFVEARKKPYFANLSLGLLQDSNILLQSDGTAASTEATDDGGLRFQMMGSFEYKAKYTKTEEFSLKTTLAYLYSFDDEFSKADPLDIIFSAPYKKNSKAFDRSYRWELDPGVEVLYMDVDEEGSRENILNAVFINWKNSFVMNENWISNYNFQLYVNDSEIDAASSDDDASSIRYTFTYNNIYFVDRSKGKTLISDVGLLFNDADGRNYKHTRLDLALNYIQPTTLWDLTVSTKLAYFQADYDSTDGREDKNLSLNLTVLRSINEWLGWNASLGYIDNSSNVSTREYDKYTIGTNLTGKWNF